MKLKHKNMSKKGFIYILLNPINIECLKIGKTTRTSEIRAKEIFRQARTGLPAEFVVAYEKKVDDIDLVERLIHKKLDRKRFNKKREFFIMPLKKAIKAIEEVMTELGKQSVIGFYGEEKTLVASDWWSELSFAWQQIFRSHIKLKYNPNEIDIHRAIHGVINYCQDNRLRTNVLNLIEDSKFARELMFWHQNLTVEKDLFNSYLPYEPTERELKRLFKLKEIDCSNNIAVIDLKPLKVLTQLKEINCNNTRISDLQPLSKHEKLEKLHLNYTRIDSLLPLLDLKKLKEINCHDTKLGESEIERFRQSNTKCIVETEIFLKMQ